MKTTEFKEWLIDKYPENSRTVSNRLSNCKNIEKYYGNLDEMIDNVTYSNVIKDLSYTTIDERNHKKKAHKIPINGNIRTGSATLKQAFNLYIEFRFLLDSEDSKYNTQVEISTKGGEILKGIMTLLDNFTYKNEFSDTKILQLNLVDYLNLNDSTYHWDEEFMPSTIVRDSIDIIGTSDDSRYKIIIELDAHRADQVAKKFVSRMALFIDENIIYIALCYPATKKMSKTETIKYFNYCSTISKSLSKGSNLDKVFGGKIINL